jgi:hypothetical protein
MSYRNEQKLVSPEKEMKRIYWSLVLSLLMAPPLIAQAPVATQAPANQPVYFYLYSRVTDQVNLDITEDRLHRLLPMIERYRTEHPEAHVSATILFSGAASEALANRNAKTHIVDFVLGFKKRGIIEIGYDGRDEPTYEHRPLVRLVDGQTSQERWLERAKVDKEFLTEGRDPLTGAPQPGSIGGLEAMQKVFGEAACIAAATVGEERLNANPDPKMPGYGATPTVKPEVGDWELIPVLRQYNTKAIMFGLPNSNPAHIPGFGGSVTGIGKLMSPAPDTSPELFWADDFLRSSESGFGGVHIIGGDQGPTGVKDFTAKLDRSKIRIIHMELDSERNYLKPDFAKGVLSPSLSYAYTHPDNPKVPQEDRSSEEEVNAAYAKEDAAIKWLIVDYFPAASGSRFVSNAELKRMTPASTKYSISVDTLRAALKNTLSDWGINTYPPSYFKVGSRFLSLAEAFQVMNDALAELDRTGKLPQSVSVVGVYGPIGMPGGHGPNVGEVTVASIAKECAEIEARLHDDTANPMPTNTIPPIVTVDGIKVNAAQFLRLMAQAIVDPTPTAKVNVRMTYMFPSTAQVFPKTRALEDTGATWTFKPAPLDISLASTQARR